MDIRYANSFCSGIDIVKILAAVFVVFLHIPFAFYETADTAAVYLVKTISYCAVDMFAIVTGYLMFEKTEIKPYKIVSVWLGVFMLLVLSGVAGVLIKGNSLVELLRSCFPLLTNKYWYFTCYCGLFF